MTGIQRTEEAKKNMKIAAKNDGKTLRKEKKKVMS